MSDLDTLARRHARNVYQALADVEPPPVEALGGPSGDGVDRSWGRGVGVAVAAAVLVLVVAIPVALLRNADGVPGETPEATSSTTTGPASESPLFAPPSTPVDGAVVFSLTFLDGSSFSLMLPESTASEIAGFVPAGAVGWDNGVCCGRSLEIQRGSTDDFYPDREPDAVYEDAAGRPVNFYENPDGLDYLVFEIDGWVIEAWDDGTGPGEQFSEEDRIRFASLFDGHVTEEGFLVLTPADPMEVRPTDIPDGTLIADDGRPQVGVIRERVCGGAPRSVTSRGYSYQTSPEAGLTTLCSPNDSSVIWISRTDLTESELDLIQWSSDSDIPTGDTTPGVLEDVPESCPVTVPGIIAFDQLSEAPEGPPSVYDEVWYGTPQLWTLINPEGEVNSKRWLDGDRTFWWSENYSPEEPGEITVTAEQLNGSAPTVEVREPAGSGFSPFMLMPTYESVTMIGIALPEPGCWELTAGYKGSTLSYVIWTDDE